MYKLYKLHRDNMAATLDIPAKYIKTRHGFSFDIGGSLIKVAYTSAESDDVVRVHFATFPRAQLDDAIALVKREVKTREKGDLVNTTGNGGYQFKHVLSEALEIKTANHPEDNCFANAFKFLVKTFPRDDTVLPPSPVAATFAQDQIQSTLAVFMKAKGELGMDENLKEFDTSAMAAPDVNIVKSGGSEAPVSEEKSSTKDDAALDREASEIPTDPEPTYPCLLFLMGSAIVTMKFSEDGSHTMVDMVTRCGSTFLGLGKLLTGVKTFEELINLAAKGDVENVSFLGKHMKGEGKDDIYGMVPENIMLYCFGQAATGDPSKFSKEDIAAALLNTMAQEIATICHLTAVAHNIPHLYFCGSFVGASQVIRDEISKYLLARSTLSPFMPFQPQHWFLKHGSFYGALGALLMPLDD